MKQHCIALLTTMLPLSAALADDCAVDAQTRTVSCAVDGRFDPNDHGGRSLYGIFNSTNPTINAQQTGIDNGWNFVYGTTAAQAHALAQFSDTLIANALRLSTSGAQADALILRNFDPTVDVNVFQAQTSGVSADGINVAREAQNGHVTVYQQLQVSSQQGLGIRANIAEYDYPTHNAITIKGSTEIDTFGPGSDQTGHAVLAGTTQACGPLNLPLFECRVVADAQASIELLGESQTIRTRGPGAAGLFAKAKGLIRARNIDIHSSGNGAFGVRANRQVGNWYFNQNTFGPYDYSGSVELLGNVTVSATGANAFALHADSFNAAGVDSLGITASIRSMDSSSDPTAAAGIYAIQGDMLARNAGIIALAMANHSQFTGTTAIASQGVIELRIAGPESRWNMPGHSSLSSLALADGATLRPGNSNSSPSDTSLSGIVSNAGTIDLSNGIAGDILRLAPRYSAEGGVLRLDTCLGDSDSPSDQLVVSGDTQGTTQLHINPVNAAQCTGALTTGDGILVVQVSGDSAGIFELASPGIQAGDFVYTLVQQGKHWYLVSEAASPAPSIEDQQLVILANQSARLNLLELNQLSPLHFEVRIGSTPASNGQIVCSADGACTYTPNPNFSGTDQFSYTVCAIGSNPPSCTSAVVDITVTPTVPPDPGPGPGRDLGSSPVRPVPVAATATLLGMSGLLLALGLWLQASRRSGKAGRLRRPR